MAETLAAPRQRAGSRTLPREPRAPRRSTRWPLAVASATTSVGLLMVGCGLALAALTR